MSEEEQQLKIRKMGFGNIIPTESSQRHPFVSKTNFTFTFMMGCLLRGGVFAHKRETELCVFISAAASTLNTSTQTCLPIPALQTRPTNLVSQDSVLMF